MIILMLFSRVLLNLIFGGKVIIGNVLPLFLRARVSWLRQLVFLFVCFYLFKMIKFLISRQNEITFNGIGRRLFGVRLD